MKLFKNAFSISQFISLHIISLDIFPKNNICLLSFIGISIFSIVKLLQKSLNIKLSLSKIEILYSIILFIISSEKYIFISSVKLFLIFKLFSVSLNIKSKLTKGFSSLGLYISKKLSK